MHSKAAVHLWPKLYSCNHTLVIALSRKLVIADYKLSHVHTVFLLPITILVHEVYMETKHSFSYWKWWLDMCLWQLWSITLLAIYSLAKWTFLGARNCLWNGNNTRLRLMQLRFQRQSLTCSITTRLAMLLNREGLPHCFKRFLLLMQSTN